MIKPNKFEKGDIVTAVSLSWGIAGEDEMLPKSIADAEIFEKEFGIRIINAPNAMRGEKFLKQNPRARADDLIWGLENKNVKGIFSIIGGNDSIDILPFIDLEVIKNNPKVFMGCSDIFAVHTLFFKAGVVSYYGGNLLTSFMGQDKTDKHTLTNIKKILFDTKAVGELVPVQEYFISDKKECIKCDGYTTVNGNGTIRGKIFVCTSELITIQKSEYALPIKAFKDVFLCFEDIVECVSPKDLYEFIVWLNQENILHQIKALVIAKFNEIPQNIIYKEAVQNALKDLSAENLPVIMGLDFGHTFPKAIIPYGITAEIDLDNQKFIIVEKALR